VFSLSSSLRDRGPASKPSCKIGNDLFSQRGGLSLHLLINHQAKGQPIKYNQANQLLKITEKDRVTIFSHDENGNMIAGVKSKVDEEQETGTYTYDFQNRLVKVEITKG